MNERENNNNPTAATESNQHVSTPNENREIVVFVIRCVCVRSVWGTMYTWTMHSFIYAHVNDVFGLIFCVDFSIVSLSTSCAYANTRALFFHNDFFRCYCYCCCCRCFVFSFKRASHTHTHSGFGSDFSPSRRRNSINVPNERRREWQKTGPSNFIMNILCIRQTLLCQPPSPSASFSSSLASMATSSSSLRDFGLNFVCTYIIRRGCWNLCKVV